MNLWSDRFRPRKSFMTARREHIIKKWGKRKSDRHEETSNSKGELSGDDFCLPQKQNQNKEKTK